ncbi:MAG TPA: ChbG/HpnK family deacetylase [Verrucomicrobiae bacterium]|nr:ChbG/HpnK family deacetylase [Verrucomicrobiae bacterium]
MKTLIVNADDCNLTPGVTAAILAAHDTGIVSSTTFMANLPIRPAEIRAIKKRKALGVGVHLNVTLGRPVSRPSQVPSLTDAEGKFRRRGDQLAKLPLKKDLVKEYAAQVLLFRHVFERLPTHLDTHHQMHDHPLYLEALIAVAKRFRLPVRRSALMKSAKSGAPVYKGVKTVDRVLGDLDPKGFWRKASLETVLRKLPEGLNEVMCHPGRIDRDLKALSSFTHGRDKERDLFRSSVWKKKLPEWGIRLANYGVCYT